MAPDLVGPVGEAGVQQQARALDRVPGDADSGRALVSLAPLVDEGQAAARPVRAGLDARDHAVGADLDAVLERVGDVRDQRRGLGVDLAALQAEAAVDAVRSVAERPVGDRDRPDAHFDAAGARA